MGYSPEGHKESDTTEHAHILAHVWNDEFTELFTPAHFS